MGVLLIIAAACLGGALVLMLRQKPTPTDETDIAFLVAVGSGLALLYVVLRVVA